MLVGGKKASPCRAPIHHDPRADVAHKPGTGAGGWQLVSPHDRGVEPYAYDTRQLAIPLKAPMANRTKLEKYGLDEKETVLELGTVTLDENGQAMLNGTALQKQTDDGCP